MIYTGLGRAGEIADVKANGGADVAEVYGGIVESNPIYYKQREMVGTSPMQFKALGLPLKDYRIYGETLQDGTPSPDMPVDVVGCGVRTENLAPNTGWVNGYITTTGTLDPNNASGEKASDFIPILSGISLAYSYRGGSFPSEGVQAAQIAWRAIAFYRSDKSFISRPGGEEPAALFTSVPNDTAYIRLTLRTYGQDVSNVMLNTGSTALPYEPYGYKIPVTIGNTTIPIYIGSDPLYRIGDYADEFDFGNQRIIRRVNPTTMQPYETPITSTATIPQLTAVFGNNTLTVDTTVKPSAVSVTGNIKPTGYGQLLDVNDVDIRDSNSTPIFIRG